MKSQVEYDGIHILFRKVMYSNIKEDRDNLKKEMLTNGLRYYHLESSEAFVIKDKLIFTRRSHLDKSSSKVSDIDKLSKLIDVTVQLQKKLDETRGQVSELMTKSNLIVCRTDEGSRATQRVSYMWQDNSREVITEIRPK